ncbi:MAG: preprotein translocase subunit SecA [Acidothermus cellulolyticus]|nr:preprotein translocase subunit SecA [Acidothermus cellulolyticus]
MPALLDKLLRAGEGKILRKLKAIAEQVNSIEDEFAKLSDGELRGLTDEFRARYADGESLDDLLPEAFAAVREAAKRTLGQRHFDVQIMGGAALHFGNIAEMKTGEGKTLVSTLPAYLNALAGRGVHVVTVNDYLARRDAEWMGRIHRFLGLEVGVISPQMGPAERKKAYAADITYGTNNEFGFDYLRDNMAWSVDEIVQRGHFYAIVDEVDSILIDEARTPLIISGPVDMNQKWYTDFAKLAERLQRGENGEGDYEVDEKKRTISITERGVQRVEDWLGIDNLYEPTNTPLVGYLHNALRAKELYKRDRDYVVIDGEVLIVDEFTGRILYGRRYNEGMHQAIEAKEGVPIKQENQTLATITLQNYFRLYEKLAGMTGTAMTEANEFHQIYKLGVVPIPTNRPMIRIDQPDVVFKTEKAKFAAVVEDIAQRHAKGQPVLVGTTSVEKSELLSGMLLRRGIPHAVLNAKYHEKEAAIVAQAGRKGAVTVATNMAGRGTDIMLGGNPEFLARQELAERGLSPVDTPEEYEAAWPEVLEKWKKAVAAEHDEVVQLGGLYVLGTERHDSRRIDNQLRGRSGRQGDPGESRFYLSLEDDLMRLFNGPMVQRIMETLNYPEDVPLESKMVTRAIRSAQTQVEQQNFEIRKNVLKYDEVLNKQRAVIYAERRRVLHGDDLHEQVGHMIDDVIRDYVRAATEEGYAEDWDLEQLWTALRSLYPVGLTIDQVVAECGGDRSGLTAEFLIERLTEDAHRAYAEREAALGTLPDGQPVMRELERRVVLAVLDRKWREHLYEMDYLQEGIQLRSYGQRDPLVEYQREGYTMFQTMLDGIKEESVRLLFSVDVQVAPAAEAPVAATAAADGAGAAAESTTGVAAPQPAGASGPALQPVPAATASGQQPVPAAAALSPGAGMRLADSPVAKLLAPPRPTRLQYTAPTIDGAAGSGEATAMTVEERRPSGAAVRGPSPASASRQRAGAGEPARPLMYAGTPRSAKCPCGSGKPYKRCHGDPRNAG